MIRTSVTGMVQEGGLCVVVGEASDGAEAVRLAAELEPDLVLMDVGMPGVGGIEATALIRASQPGLRVIALSMYDDAATVRAAILAGAQAFCSKKATKEDLRRAVQEVAAGRSYFPPGSAEALVAMIREPGMFGGVHLGPRELETLRLTAEGRSAKEAAGLMGISPATVHGYRKVLCRKTGAHGNNGLTRFYLDHASRRI